ncbi:hypothetical protein CC86DRAFT_378607 [Ophiobolus disseminans]|uniref:Uncharacterized protein n=1 Tax=Ophiobolus disseminans TaxID=1469910 RepID=A0A6A7AAG2_9PLEO|nr:hypothetical protein CC86DRAFT_378607 [Ophiobolus disseminans]
MSDTGAQPTQRVRVNGRFDPSHIGAFGLASVGRVYLTIAPSGRFLKAEAKLIDATFERMLIDDPNILRIFGERGETIDMSILHPFPRFRIEPVDLDPEDSDDLDFTVGRLVDITHLPAAARFGTSKFHLGMVDRSEIEQRREKSKQGDMFPETMTEPSTAHNAPTKDVEPTTSPRSSRARSTTPRRRQASSIPKGPVGRRMSDVLGKIMERLDDLEQGQYKMFIHVMRLDAGDDVQMKREFHSDLQDFVKRHDITELHNEYAKYQKSSGANRKYHLPVFEGQSGFDSRHANAVCSQTTNKRDSLLASGFTTTPNERSKRKVHDDDDDSSPPASENDGHGGIDREREDQEEDDVVRHPMRKKPKFGGKMLTGSK